ncbi:hypothetical protein Pyn_21567 [Prunus yedoensis var. nudiflora]|uniref:PAP/OAS1 substrate-binding-related domain-containing protein n=1 Tax=Prunus yedoensis var. nudiflora TaxID=2094558 RepID=A0A314YMQ3_PRUYE|nr:hypothetical protein Pyn_21567 [Prunus yedoensis var. nudiflora]
MVLMYLLASNGSNKEVSFSQSKRMKRRRRKKTTLKLSKVFSFGSVPLKTYLPDGDIDLTAICHQNAEEELAIAVCGVLESQPKDSLFQFKDVRYVRAQVLQRFLEYYSTFDWDNYCISINGPVAICSLPEIIGNFYRIKSALSMGAQNLREILKLPGESMGAELEKFFMTTIDRNGRGERPDVNAPVCAFGIGKSEESDLWGEYGSYYSSMLYGQAFHRSTHHSAPPSGVCNKTTWNALAWSVQLNWNEFCERATKVYARLPLRHPSASHLSADTIGVGITRKSQGTGTFIPDVKQHTSENDSRFNLSPEEFPLLPGTENGSPEVHQSGHLVLASPPTKEPSHKLGSSGHSPSLSGMPSPVASQQANTHVSYTLYIMKKQQELSEVDEETIRMQQFKLDDDEDFPPESVSGFSMAFKSQLHSEVPSRVSNSLNFV